VAKNDPLLAHFDLGERTPRREEVLRFPRRFVVISVDEVDRLTGNLLTIGRYGFRSAHAKVAEELEHVIWLHRIIPALQDGPVHLLRIREWTIAVANDVEVPKVKVGGKPNIGHHQII
jgi:hypothetical protein